jgi:beta-glucosidase
MKSWIALMAITAILLCLAALNSRISAQQTISAELATTPDARSDGWWTERHAAKLKEKAANREQIQLVMIGDSITHSWEKTATKIWSERYAKYRALNLGYSGDRTEHVLWRLENGEVAGLNPKLVVLMIGTNNAGHRHEPSEFTAAGVKAILDDLRERLPDAKLLLLAIFPRDASPEGAIRQLTDGTNAIIQKYADGEHIFYLDVADAFLDDDKSLPKSIMPDLLHPNEAGYQLWADAMQPKIDELISSE